MIDWKKFYIPWVGRIFNSLKSLKIRYGPPIIKDINIKNGQVFVLLFGVLPTFMFEISFQAFDHDNSGSLLMPLKKKN